MKIEDAAKVLGLDGELNKDTIKAAYRKACSMYHPDKGGSVEMMQMVNAAYEVLENYEGTVDLGDNVNYGEILNEAINRIITLEGIKIEVCGAWVWVTGNTKPYAKLLGKKEGGAGFTFASKKKAWYYRPADWKSSSRGKWSLDEIRDNYGSIEVETQKSAKIKGGAA